MLELAQWFNVWEVAVPSALAKLPREGELGRVDGAVEVRDLPSFAEIARRRVAARTGRVGPNGAGYAVVPA